MWRPVIIEGKETDYIVSDTGEIGNVKRQGLLKPYIRGHGYYYVDLRVNGERHVERVHRLVAIAFLEREEGCHEVNHKDGDKLNNHVSNLQWISRAGNMKHAFKEELFVRKLTPADVESINCLFERGLSMPEIAKKFNVSVSMLEKIKAGTSWNY